MPNTAVKPLYAESTRLETVREDRELPVRRKGLHRKMQAFLSRPVTGGVNFSHPLYLSLDVDRATGFSDGPRFPVFGF